VERPHIAAEDQVWPSHHTEALSFEPAPEKVDAWEKRENQL
jgi:hypothetical protein